MDKDNKIFHTCKTHQGLFTVKVLREWGFQQKILRLSQKKWNFHTFTCKSACQSQRSRSKVHLV